MEILILLNQVNLLSNYLRKEVFFYSLLLEYQCLEDLLLLWHWLLVIRLDFFLILIIFGLFCLLHLHQKWFVAISFSKNLFCNFFFLDKVAVGRIHKDLFFVIFHTRNPFGMASILFISGIWNRKFLAVFEFILLFLQI